MIWRTRLVVILLSSSAWACSEGEPNVSRAGSEPPAGRPPDAEACTRPLAELCTRHRCLPYDEQMRAYEDSAGAKYGGCDIVLGSLTAGTCGTLLYTRSGHAYGSETRYYDASGVVVAARVVDDVPGGRCDDPPFGFAPACTHVRTRDLCRERLTAAAAR